jgi:hypothetical protein
MTPPSLVGRMSPTLVPTSSSRRSPASKAVGTIARSRSAQSVRRRDPLSALITASSPATASAPRLFGSVFASFGRPMSGIGLAGISSAVNRNVHNTFQLDQQRRIELSGERRGPAKGGQTRGLNPPEASLTRTNRPGDPWLNDTEVISLEAQLITAAVLDTPTPVHLPGTPLSRLVTNDTGTLL